MKSFGTPLSIHRGTVEVNGNPVVFVSADYPYYRDYRENWEQRLSQIKAMGISVVSAYIPWRHHQPDANSAPDFSGTTQPNRDVLGFFRLCQKLGLAVIAKPGPFIHAETNYGGLPDWVCPLNNEKIEPVLDSNGNGLYWSGGRLNAAGTRAEDWPFPAPFDPEFARLTRAWLSTVGAQVITPGQSPHGPIVAVQIANEGIYSNGQHGPWAYDYSASALKLYHDFLAQEYDQNIERFNAINGAEYDDWNEIPAPRKWNQAPTPRTMRCFMDWGKFQAWYMNRVFAEWSAPLKTSLPVIINQNPPMDGPTGLDSWLTRVEPEAWRGVHYGFTNWVGDVSQDTTAFDRYLLAAKRFPGVNMEENWGFAELYDPAYVDAATSFYQTLVILNGGATGYNIYTGVGTGHKDTNLEVIPKAPYPDAAPITSDGEFTPKAEIVRWMSEFMDTNGADFLVSQPVQSVAFGVYLPLARVAVWAPDKDAQAPSHGHHLGEFQRQMRAQHLDYGILNLETVSVNALLTYPALVVASGKFMSSAVQKKLADYVLGEGRLTIVGELPEVDENFNACTTLAQVANLFTVTDKVDVQKNSLKAESPSVGKDPVDLWVRSHPTRDLHFVTVLIPTHGNSNVKVSFRAGMRQHALELSAACAGGAILRVEEGRVTDFIIKGHNGYLDCSVPPRFVFDGDVRGAEQPGDFIRVGKWTSHLVPENK